MKSISPSTARLRSIPCVLVIALTSALGAACTVAADGMGGGAGAPPPGADDIDNSGPVDYPAPPKIGGAECGALLCSDTEWWNAPQTNCKPHQSPPACSYTSALGGWWDTDLAVHASTPVVLRHASRLDSQAVYKWGWMPQFTDMVTGEQFRFLHLRPENRYTSVVGTTYDIGTVVGLSGGDTANTGYGKYSTGAHLCVQTQQPFAKAFPGAHDACSASCPGGFPPPPSSCPSGSGYYCASDGKTLQDCSGGTSTFAAYCLPGCHVAPAGQNDSCNAGSCPSGNGAYCGSDIGSGLAANTLYDCTGGKVTLIQTCPNGCQVAPPGQPDHCN